MANPNISNMIKTFGSINVKYGNNLYINADNKNNIIIRPPDISKKVTTFDFNLYPKMYDKKNKIIGIVPKVCPLNASLENKTLNPISEINTSIIITEYNTIAITDSNFEIVSLFVYA